MKKLRALDKNFDKILSKLFKRFLNLSHLRSAEVQTSQGALHYYQSKSENPEDHVPALFLHGLGSSAQSFALLSGMLQDKRLILPDLMGFQGFSQSAKRHLSIKNHVDVMLQLLDALQLEQVDLCGLSLGGWIGMEFAATYPERVRSLALMNPAGVLHQDESLRKKLLELDWESFLDMYRGMMVAKPFSGVPIVSKIVQKSIYRSLKSEGVRDFVSGLSSDSFVDSVLHRIVCPTLLIWGKEDQFLPAGIPEYLGAHLRKLETVFLENCAHVPPLEAPLQVSQHLRDFWEKQTNPHRLRHAS